MKILDWMHNKINEKKEKKRFDPVSASAHYDRKEEFSDWPQALLSIGTFGTNGMKENQERCSSSEEESKEDDVTLTMDSSENSESLYELPNFTLEDVSSLHKELTKLLTLEPKASKDDGLETCGERPANLPLNRFLNCPSSLKLDRVASDHDLSNNEEGDHLSPKSKIILSKAKDILTDNGTKIKRRSVKFLLKKLFACRSSFPPIPNIRDPVPESKMEKILRMMLNKKIYPQSPAPSMKHLDKKPSEKSHRPSEDDEEGCKWVKTDSEFIVLEI